MNLLHLPLDVISFIIQGNLDVVSVIRLSETCSLFHRLIMKGSRHNAIWRSLYRQDFSQVLVAHDYYQAYRDATGWIEWFSDRRRFIEAAGNGYEQYLVIHPELDELTIKQASRDAARRGHRHVITYLVSTYKDSDVGTISVDAAESGHFNIVTDMVERGANEYGSYLQYGAKYNRKDIVDLSIEYLKKHEVNIGIYPIVASVTEAAYQGYVDILKSLFSLWKPSKFDRALCDAIRGNQTDTIKYLLDEGAEVTAETWKYIGIYPFLGCCSLIVEDQLTRGHLVDLSTILALSSTFNNRPVWRYIIEHLDDPRWKPSVDRYETLHGGHAINAIVEMRFRK